MLKITTDLVPDVMLGGLYNLAQVIITILKYWHYESCSIHTEN